MILQESIFSTDLEGFFYLGVAIIGALVFNLLISYIFSKIKRIPRKYKLFANLIIRIIFIAIIIWLIFEIPLIKELFQNELIANIFAITTSAVSIGLGFAFSGIFSNFVAGLVLFSVKPFEVGDIIKINGDMGVVRAIKLRTTVIETFDNIIVEKANNDVIATDILNYTIDMGKIKTFLDFKKELHYTEDLISPSRRDAIRKGEELSLKSIFKTLIKQKKYEKVHNYIFIMEFPYKGFHKLINQVEKICQNYQDKFGLKPTYHIAGFRNNINVFFRILTFRSANIFEYQPNFAKEIYSIIFDHYLKSKIK